MGAGLAFLGVSGAAASLGFAAVFFFAGVLGSSTSPSPSLSFGIRGLLRTGRTLSYKLRTRHNTHTRKN
jgi:hypothetical protein